MPGTKVLLTVFVVYLSNVGDFTGTAHVALPARKSFFSNASQAAQAANSELDLRLVFHGYLKIGVPQSGAAVVSEMGVSDIHDITFTRIGGELSPNGRLIAYDNCSAFKRGIYLAEPDGTNARLVLSLTESPCVSIRWSPDNTKLSFSGQTDRGIRIYDIASNASLSIANTEGASLHSWAPNGAEIVYERRTPHDSVGPTGRLLYITDLEGNNRQLTFTADFMPCGAEKDIVDTWAPTWSPKGDKIAFTQCGALFTISPAGKNLRQLTPFSSAYSPRWSPDGGWILFMGGGVCVISEGAVLKRIAPDANRVVDIGKLPYCGGPFSIAPLRR